MENTPSKVMTPRLFRRGEVLPDAAVPMTDMEVLNIQNKRIENFTPQREMKIFQLGNYMLAATAGMSGYLICNIFRRNFRLGGLKMVLTYGPSVLLPSMLSYGLHEILIKPKILLGMASCPTCLSVKAGALQSVMGLCYPYLVSLLTCVVTAREFYTLDLTTAKKQMGYFRLLRHLSPSPNILLAVGLLNMLVAMEVSRQEMQVYIKHLSKPPSPNTSEYGDKVDE